MILFFAHRYGMLGNRLHRYSHVCAWCWENGFTLWDPTFKDYSHFFPNLARDPLASNETVFHGLSGQRTVRKAISFILPSLSRCGVLPRLQDCPRKGRFFELDNDDGKRWLQTHHGDKIVSIHGFSFAAESLRKKYHKRLQVLFEPAPEYLCAVDQLLRKRKGNSLLIGVHIRRGDYSTFYNGLFYYEFEEYYQVLERLVNEVAKRSIQFFISCDEPIGSAIFNRFDVLFGTSHPIVDMYMLSKCDFIVGPVSSFSDWAAFYGQKPKIQLWGHPIWKPEQDLQLKAILLGL